MIEDKKGKVTKISASTKHTNLLNKLVAVNSQKSRHKISPEYLNTFVYNDHISNQVMPIVRDERQTFNNVRYSQKTTINNISYTRIQESFDLMKSTRKFHITSIQAKNYRFGRNKENSVNASKFVQADESTDFSALLKTKLNLYRRKRKNYKEQFSKQKQILSKILKTQDSQQQIIKDPKQESDEQLPKEIVNQSIKNRLTFPRPQKMNSSYYKYHSIYRENVNEIKKQNNVKSKTNYQKMIARQTDKETQGFYERAEQQAIKDITSELRYRVRKNAQFLIEPDLHKRLKFKNTKAIQDTLTQEQSTKLQKKSGQMSQKYFQKSDLENYQFKINQEYPKLKEINFIDTAEKKAPQLLIAEVNLIKAIEMGNFFRVEIELQSNPELLMTKEKTNNNNLLHICVMNNKEEIFEMILKKCREVKKDLLAEKNKHGRSPLQLGKILSFFKKKQLLKLIESIERDRLKGAFSLLNSIFSL